MKGKGLLVKLEIHDEYQGTEGLCNNQGNNLFFYQNNIFCSHILFNDYDFSTYIYFVIILSWEKICQTLLLIFSAIVALACC